MYNPTISSPQSSFTKMSVAVMIASTALLSGCQSTMHTGWAEDRDSTFAWAPKIATLPLDVHGSIPGQTAAQTIATVPLAITSAAYSDTNPDAPNLMEAQRIVLYVGGDQLPVNTTYCDKSATLRTVKVVSGRVLLGAALCDGPRLVVTERQVVKPEAVTVTAMNSSIESAKKRLMVALEVGQDENTQKGPYAGE
jgi:hypothetical protein